MAANYDNLTQRAIQIRNNVNPSSNTAQLVGGELVDIVAALREIAQAAGLIGPYVFTTDNAIGATSVTIEAETHGCGTNPIVQCYVDNQVALFNITNIDGDITISWKNATDITAEHPLTVIFSIL